jgi:hypothetical protein
LSLVADGLSLVALCFWLVAYHFSHFACCLLLVLLFFGGWFMTLILKSDQGHNVLLGTIGFLRR